MICLKHHCKKSRIMMKKVTEIAYSPVVSAVTTGIPINMPIIITAVTMILTYTPRILVENQ